jgi:predicted nucleic acid-binding protein
MMYLLDTNIWLERLLDQARADEVRRLLAIVSSEQLLLSHFSLHSIGVILGRYGERETLQQFTQDLFVDGLVQLATVPPTDFAQITAAMAAHRLDFDDAYQYVATRRAGAELVSFDTDFDRTDLPRLTPADLLARLQPPSAGE